MASNYQDIVNRYLAASPVSNPDAFNIPDAEGDIILQKMGSLNQRMEQKKLEAMARPNGQVLSSMVNENVGNQSGNQRERDFASMTPNQFRERYGDDVGEAYTSAYGSGDTVRRMNVQGQRSAIQMFGDTLNTVATAPVQMLGGIGAAGLGLVNDKAGTVAAEAVGDLTSFMQDRQSDALNAERDSYGVRQSLSERDNAAQYDQDVKTDGTFIAGAKRIWNDTVDSFNNAGASPGMALDTVANAGGSLIGGGVLSSGLRKLGRAVMGGAVKTGAIAEGSAAASRISAFGSKAAMPTAIVGMEGGAAYQQTVEEALNQLQGRTDLTDDQKREMANNAGLEAAAIQAAATAALLPVTGGASFERAPFSVQSMRQAVRRALGETVEEGVQEGSAQLAQNRAIQDQVNPDQVLSEGVGQGVALGAIGGIGSSVATQAPGMAVQAALETAKLPFKGVSKILTYAGDRVIKRNQAAQDAALAEPDTEIAAGPEEVPAYNGQTPQYDISDPDVQETAKIWGFSQDQIERAINEPDFRSQVEMTKAMKKIDDESVPLPERLDAAGEVTTLEDESAQAGLLDQQEGMKGIKATFDRVVNNPVIKKGISAAKSLYETNAPKVIDQMGVVLDRYESLKKNTKADPAELEQIDTAVRTGAKYMSDMAYGSPQNIDPAVVDKILYHDETENFLSSSQRSTLRTAAALVRGQQAAAELANTKYGLADVNDVSREVLTRTRNDGGEAGKKSLVEHMQGIRSAYNSRNFERAADLLTDLRFFAEHMSNKVEALNASFGTSEGGRHPSVKYPSLTSRRRFTESGNGLTVIPKVEKSVRFAQQVALEAAAVVGVTNNLIEAFPDLGLAQLTAPVLDAALDGEAATVSAEYRSGVRSVPGQQVEPVAEPVEETGQVEAPLETDTAPVEDTQEEVSEPEPNPNQPESEQAPEPDSDLSQIDDTPEAEDISVPTSISEAYPDLLGGENNRLDQAFALPEKGTTRTRGVDSPMAVVKEGLKNETTFRQLIDGELNRAYTPAVAAEYQGFLALGDSIADAMQKRLTTFLNKPETAKHDRNDVVRWINGQAANIANVDGVYDPKLLQNAVLAGLQWFLKMNQFGSELDEKDVRSILRLEANDILPSDLVNQINDAGMGAPELVRSLSREIGRFWGLDEKADAPRNYAEGVREGVAKELLHVMMNMDIPMLVLEEVDISDVTKNPKVTKLNRYRMAEHEGRSFLDPTNPIREFPTAIERAVLFVPEELNHIGEAPKTQSKTQLRNANVENTPEQIAAIKKQQQVPHFWNLPFVDMLTDMGEDMVLRLFAGGDLNDKLFNANHKRSLQGRNLTVQSAFRTIQSMLAETGNYASLNDSETADVPVFFDYNDTVVNRQQMLGKDNPQSNKLMREAILPTWQEMDLTDGAQRDLFYMGLAQALGIKVHVQPKADSIAQVQKKLDGFVTTIPLLLGSNAQRFSAESIDQMKAEGIDSVAALHAVMEYGRYLNEATDKSKFRTAVYFEADGVTNGVVNAMAMFSAGEFTETFLNNISRGGYHVGENPMSLSDLRQSFEDGSEDLYAIAGTKTTEHNRKLRAEYLGNPDIMPMLNAVRDIVGEWMEGVSADEGEGLIVKRGAVKSPLTKTIYGAGASGLASGMVDDIVSAIYERLSLEAQRVAENPNLTEAQAFYGGDAATAQIKFDRLMNNLSVLMGNRLFLEKGVLQRENLKSGVSKSFGDPTKFTFPKEALKNMRDNVQHGFVSSMVEGITETVGADLMASLETIKTQVQAWSLVGQFAYQKAYAEALAAKGYTSKNDLLSRAEEDAVLKNVWSQLPYFSTGQQNFLFGMSQSMDGNSEFAKGFTQGFDTPAFGYTPSDAGVSGIPGLTIGSGDGQTILNAVADPEMPKGFLQIFDGVHSSALEMEQMGKVTNKAVFGAWQRNPMGELTKAFSTFVAQADLSDLSKEQRAKLTRSLFPTNMWRTPQSSDAIKRRMELLARYAQQLSDAVSERHEVMNKVQSSVDQMAGAAAPHQNVGIILSGSPQQKAAAMEQMRKGIPEEVAPSQDTEAAEAVPMRIVTPNLMGKALEKAIAKMTPDRLTRALLRDVVRSGRVDEYSIFTGSREELLNKAVDLGIVIPAGRMGFSGFTVPGAKTIFVVDGNVETMLHELIHAATFEAVQAYYDGNADTATQLAVQNLEGLLAQFKEADFEGEAYQNALDEIERQEAAGSPAGALNEFMAWSLANAELTALLKAEKASPAVRMARNVIAAIKRLLWGGKRSAAVKDDMFSNIRFNTNVIMRAQSVATQAHGAMLFHDTSFGNNERLTALEAKIAAKMTDYADTDAVSQTLRAKKTDAPIRSAVRVAQAFQNAGFNMTRQEEMAFIQMVAIMGTDAQLDPNSSIRMQELFTHVGKQLAVQDFLRNPEEDDNADSTQANEKFDIVMGRFAGRTDAYGRSVVLPAFVALATVNEEFRSILGRMEMPKVDYAQWNSVNNILDNIGDMSIDNLSRFMSGEGTNAANIQDAIDGLMEHMLQTAEESRMFVEKFTSPAGSAIDKINAKVVEGFEYVGNVTQSNVDNLRERNASKPMIAVAETLNSVAALLNEKNGLEAATRAMKGANQRKLWRPIYDLMKDLVGRTNENAPIYDLIKVARAWVNGMRQQFREQLPRIVNSKFSRELSDQEQTNLHMGIGQTDAAALMVGRTVDQVLELLSDKAARDVEIARLRKQIDQLSPQHGKRMQLKAEQLARYMVTKRAEQNLLRNAEAIGHLLGEQNNVPVPSKELVASIDALTSLLAFNNVAPAVQTSIASLAQSEAGGMNFMLSYVQGQKSIDADKATGNARFNHFKGYTASDNANGVSLIISHANGKAKLLEKSYQELSGYTGSSKDPTRGKRAYYFATISSRAPYAQGIMQNVQQTVSGVDQNTGFSLGLTAGQITEPELVQKIAQNRTKESGDALMPVYDENGTLYAYERSVDPAMLSRLNQNTNMAKMMGVRSGRQSEEANAFELNKALIDRLRDMYDADKKAGRTNEYVNLNTSKDTVHQDAIKIFSNEVRDYLDARFPEGFYVRKDMIDDAVGYRSASIGDAWNGTSRWSPATQDHVKKMLMGVFGNKAFQYAVKSEQLLQNVVQDVRVAIVIKSVVVPMANAASNVFQLIGRGVPITKIARDIPKKTAEIESWHKSRIRQIEAEAELKATTDPLEKRRLRAELQTIKDSHKRLSIWPLLEAGEFSSVSDAGSREDILLTEGKLSEFLEAAVNRLPPAVRTAGKYAIISKDTALFRALQKSVEYGDFVAKAILYDDLVSRQGKTKAEALGRVTEEFVNYDRLPGRDRAYLESIGLMWFWNFKVRSAKIAMSMVRNNPVHSLIASVLPTPFNGMGLPIEDNLWAALFDGRLSRSVGYDMMFRAPGLLPLGNLLF